MPRQPKSIREASMKRPILVALATTALVLSFSISPSVTLAADRHFSAQLSGSEEVPARDTDAIGHANFTLVKDGTELRYRLVVSNIQNVTAAQIHIGARGTNGPVVATLYGPVAPGGGKKSGLLASGTITSSDLTGDLAGHPLSDLAAAMLAGNAYVNIHTDDGISGSGKRGDLPDGEIRGQIH